MLTVLMLIITTITRKGGNCDALQLEAVRRRASRSGLYLRGSQCTSVSNVNTIGQYTTELLMI